MISRLVLNEEMNSHSSGAMTSSDQNPSSTWEATVMPVSPLSRCGWWPVAAARTAALVGSILTGDTSAPAITPPSHG